MSSERAFEITRLYLTNYQSDEHAIIAQRAAAGISGEPYHYSLVNFAVVLTVARRAPEHNRIFHRIGCEIELLRLKKTIILDFVVDLMDGERAGEMERRIYSQPLGQVEPGSETAVIRIMDGTEVLRAIEAPVKFCGPESLNPFSLSAPNAEAG